MTAGLETSEPAALRPRPRSMTRRVVLALVACIAVLGLWAWLKPEPLLRGAADLWIVSDEPAPADAVAVLGGGLEYRPFAAADYYRRGFAPKILVSNVGATPAEQLGVLQSHVRANSEVLQKLGVPGAAIEPFGDHLSDTFTEATALHDWAVALESPSTASVDLLEQAIRLDPDFGAAWVVLAGRDIAAGNRAAAEDVIAKFRKLAGTRLPCGQVEQIIDGLMNAETLTNAADFVALLAER